MGKCQVSIRFANGRQAHLRPAPGATPSPGAGRGGVANLHPATNPTARTDHGARPLIGQLPIGRVPVGHTTQEAE